MTGARPLLQALPGASEDNRMAFYRGWSQLWAQQLSIEAATLLAAASSEPPGQWRSNATLANQPGFATAYKCKVPGPMASPESSRIKVW